MSLTSHRWTRDKGTLKASLVIELLMSVNIQYYIHIQQTKQLVLLLLIFFWY